MKEILITGANRGLGLEFVRQYLQHGERVFAVCRTPDRARSLWRLQEAFPDHLLLFRLDLEHPDRIPALVEELGHHTGKLDILINNAGIYPENRIHSFTLEQIQSSFLVNATTPALLTRALCDLLKRGERPLVVNISSLLGSISEGAGTGRWADYAYGPSKAALNRMTRQFALDLRPLGITVIAQNPGWVRTDMGGPDAPLAVEQAVLTLRELFAALELGDSGRILEPDGTDAPW